MGIGTAQCPERTKSSEYPQPWLYQPKQANRFRVVTENGTELLRSGRQIGPFEIGALYNFGGKNWVVFDIDPLLGSDDKWTIVVRPETSDSPELESLGW